jgi:hypothetical protein
MGVPHALYVLLHAVLHVTAAACKGVRQYSLQAAEQQAVQQQAGMMG